MGILEWFGAKPSMDAFAQRLLARLQREQPGEWRWDRADGFLVHASSTRVNLVNIHLEYSAAARSVRAALLDKYSGMALMAGREPPKLWALAAKQVFVVLRSRYDVDISGIGLRDDARAGSALVTQPFLDDLQLRLVYDWGPSVSSVPPEVLETWGQPQAAVFAQGLHNLGALQAPTWQALGAGVYSLHSEVSYGESFLLVPKVVDRLAFAAHAVLAPCNRGVLLAADSRSESALLALLQAAIVALHEQPWPMTHTVCERDGQGWRMLAREGAVGAKLREFQRLSQFAIYHDQKAELDKLHERQGVAVFVATFSLMQRAPEGPVESWATWTQGVPTLLPRTDLVALLRDPTDPASKPKLVAWEALTQACGQLMQDTEESPNRWRTLGFPDAQVWERL